MCGRMSVAAYHDFMQAAQEIAHELNLPFDAQNGGSHSSVHDQVYHAHEAPVRGDVKSYAQDQMALFASSAYVSASEKPRIDEFSKRDITPSHCVLVACTQESQQSDDMHSVPAHIPDISAEQSTSSRQNERLSMHMLQWGYTTSWSKRPVFNTRIEKAASPYKNMWSDSYIHRHCCVLVSRFFERNTQHHEVNGVTPAQFVFMRADHKPFFLAGIYRENEFSLLTCTPNEVVGRVHNRMPIVMGMHEAVEWMRPQGHPHFTNNAVDLICTPVRRHTA